MIRQFFGVYYTTATIVEWRPLLADDEFKDIIIGALRFCVENKRAKIWAFIIMDNHMHLVWEILEPHTLGYVRRNMLKFISQRIIHRLLELNREDTLNQFLVRKKDRHFQIWKRDPLSVEIVSDNFLWQKINYIHLNKTRKGLNDVEYKYSSAYYYATGNKNWDFLI